MRIDRLSLGNFGDCKPLRQGVWELRIDLRPGYRVYYGMLSKRCVLLLCTGDKRRQPADVAKAVDCWSDYRNRVKEQ